PPRGGGLVRRKIKQAAACRIARDQQTSDRSFEESVNHTFAALSAASTRSFLNGTRRRRTPVASKIAFATAAIIGLHDVSPAPEIGRTGRVRLRSALAQTIS